MQTMMGEATIQQVAFSFNDLWSSPIGFHRLRLQSDNSTERSRSGTDRSIQIENKQDHTLQRTEDRVESGCISSCCSKDDHCGDDGCGVDRIGDDDHIDDDGCDVDHIGDDGGGIDHIDDDGVDVDCISDDDGDVDHIGDGDFNDVN